MFNPKAVLGILIWTAALLPAHSSQLLFTALSDRNPGDDASGGINATGCLAFDFSHPEAHGVKTAQIVSDSTQSGEAWDIYGWTRENSPLNGLAGTALLTSVSCYTGNTAVCAPRGIASGPLTLPNPGALPTNHHYFRIVETSIGYPSANIAVEEIDFGTAAPEPLGMLLAGCGLIALGLVRRRAR
jgi:hypothetical protein